MTGRDELVAVLQKEVVKTGLANTSAKVFKMILLNNVIKMTLTGRSMYDIMRYLSAQSNRCGRDLLPVVQEVYDLIKDVEL